MIKILDDRVEAGFNQADTGKILNWIEAARPFAPLLHQNDTIELNVALSRAGRRMELLKRLSRATSFATTVTTG